MKKKFNNKLKSLTHKQQSTLGTKGIRGFCSQHSVRSKLMDDTFTNKKKKKD